ncbi:Sterol-4-alpha-carboxylate 3-dehydrogenase, decarboxylating-like [Oopsacas minuta]|uniref:Sterol-4-alpha-carboxylate 3-dehydrogenase, decarboxylating-like n=1 Tax=Oopsacas minuta TaxID=111878 RepID=A0AAV7JKI1_9METZ|nr:Sterol-4-alpha-carboxylate 3-dehydrogenase, decarboxylating-like [Oopsacas minuta]
MSVHTRSSCKQKCMVVGGSGFLGRNLVDDLLTNGYTVSVFDVRETNPPDDRISFFEGDMCNLSDLSTALEDCEIVFHCASPPPSLGNRDLFYRVNVTGTHTLVEACKLTRVRKLVLTSSASVVYNGVDLKAGNEQLPYTTSPIDYYTQTKALQEQIVLNANSQELMTCAIRPHGIFGPGDQQCIPGIIAAARAGKTKYKIGDGSNLVDFTYVRNVTYGMVLAAESLRAGSQSCGSVYNITNDSPIPFWVFLSRILTGLNYPAPTRSLPYKFVYFIAWITQLICWLVSPVRKITPTLTPLKVALAGTHHYYSCTKAKSEIGYSPKFSMEEAIRISLDNFQHLKNK